MFAISRNVRARCVTGYICRPFVISDNLNGGIIIMRWKHNAGSMNRNYILARIFKIAKKLNSLVKWLVILAIRQDYRRGSSLRGHTPWNVRFERQPRNIAEIDIDRYASGYSSKGSRMTEFQRKESNNEIELLKLKILLGNWSTGGCYSSFHSILSVDWLWTASRSDQVDCRWNRKRITGALYSLKYGAQRGRISNCCRKSKGRW